jgi:hypothetical protein
MKTLMAVGDVELEWLASASDVLRLTAHLPWIPWRGLEDGRI